jgi:RND family efflux transporter MFP subunit
VLIVLSLFAIIVWLVFFKFKWLPFNTTWKVLISVTALTICLVVLGALHYYTPMSRVAVVAAHAQHIYPEISGRVDKVFVSRSDTVSAGDKLFSIDPRPFQYAVDNWTATLKLAELELKMAQQLVAKDAIASVALDEKLAARDKARAELSTAQYNLENTVIVAPADGNVSIVTLRPGQRVDPNSVALNFISTSEVWISGAFSQNGMRLMAPGQQAMVSFNSAPGVIYYTQVALIPQAVVQGQVTPEDAINPFDAVTSAQDMYPVRITFPSDAPEELARPGVIAQVTVFTDEGNPINILAKILKWISTWANYL